MAIESWEEEFLGSLPAFEGLTQSESREIFALILQGPEDAAAAVRRLVQSADPATAAMRMFGLGAVIERYRAVRDLQGSGAPAADTSEAASPIPGHPDLRSLLEIDIDKLLPDVPALHRQTQAALLKAIQRAAEATDDVDSLHTLADAYITLPSPHEDDVQD